MVRDRLLHIFRNTPYGRENLLQSAYFCRQLRDLPLAVHVPEHPRVVLRFGVDEVTIFLDKSYQMRPGTARQNIQKIVAPTGADLFFFEPREYASPTLPVLPTNYRLMACPRAVAAHQGAIGMGHLGPKVRAIICRAHFPLLIPAMAFRPWKRVAVLYGGSHLSASAVRVALELSSAAKVPLQLFTHLGDTSVEACERMLEQQGLSELLAGTEHDWTRWQDGEMGEHLMDIPHDSLVVLGAAGHNLVRELVFGSKLELVQSHLPNPLLVIGPKWKPWSPQPA